MGRRRFGEKQGVFSDNCRLPCTALLFFTTTLGMPTSSKTDEFSEKFQTAFDPEKTPLYQFHGQIALFKGPNFATSIF